MKPGLISLFGTGVLVPALVYIQRTSMDFQWHYASLPLLGIIQTLTAFSAVSTGLILFLVGVTNGQESFRSQHVSPMATSLLTMGIMIGVAAALPTVDDRYLLVDILAQICGAVFSWVLFLPSRWQSSRWVVWWLPALASTAAIAFSSWLVLSPVSTPSLVQNGHFTPLFALVDRMSGLLFLPTICFFIARFVHHRRSSDIVLAHLTVLTVATDFVTPAMYVWGPVWWSWEVLQLVGFLIMSLYILGLHVKFGRELRDSEARLNALTRELSRSNRELENFAQIASHDLKEPLRTIMTSLGMLERLQAPHLRNECQVYLQSAMASGRRLYDMVSGLLDYARANHEPQTLQMVDSGQIVQAALRDLDTLIAESGTQVRVGSLPRVLADPLQLARVFANLVQNAIRYRRELPPEIQIDARRDHNEWRFEVRDNGMGIPESQQARVFEIFKRGPGHEHQEGVGMGLAASKAIIERHGGTIGVSSVPGEGSCFHFNLPA